MADYTGASSAGRCWDRIELHIEVPAVPATQLLDTPAGEASAEVRAREAEARERAVRRQGKANQALQGAETDRHAQLDAAASWPARSRIWRAPARRM